MSAPSLRQIALAMVAARVHLEPGGGPESDYLAAMSHEVLPRMDEATRVVRAAVEGPNPEDMGLVKLARAFELSFVEVLAVALAARVEEDVMTGRALSYVQAPLGGSRPTLGLMAAAFGLIASEGELTPAVLAQGMAVRGGLLQLGNEGAPYPERTVSLPMPLSIALTGRESAWPGGYVGVHHPLVPLPESVRELGRRHAGGLGREDAPVLALRSGSSEEARSAAMVVAEAMGLRPFLADASTPVAGLAAWLHMGGLVPVFVLDAVPGEMRTVPSIPLYRGPILVVSGMEGTIHAPDRDVIPWRLPFPTMPEREGLWREALGDAELAGEMARAHRLGAARIAQLGRLALYHARLAGLPRPDRGLLSDISRSGEGSGLEGLAQLLPDPVSSSALVLSQEVRSDMENLLARCRNREDLPEGLGLSTSTRYTPGVRALFTGPSGTGKTLAAGWLATRLGLPLFRVDLASVTSKYIGETEKNLEKLLSRAERTEAVLLFDEADSLFGNRTDVRDSNDRFANAQTNYLLQRMETFDGIAVLTSNSRARFDTAFARRLDAVIDFPPPGPAARRALWEAHLGPRHGLGVVDLNLLASQSDLAGGQIRNVVLAAAVTAREGRTQIGFRQVLLALEGEYRKSGKSLSHELHAALHNASAP